MLSIFWIAHKNIVCSTVRIFRAIARARAKTPIISTRQLAAIVTAAVRNHRTDRFSRQPHAAVRTFQALRLRRYIFTAVYP